MKRTNLTRGISQAVMLFGLLAGASGPARAQITMAPAEEAYGINNLGQVVGDYYPNASDFPFNGQGWVYNPGGLNSPFNGPSGVNGTSPLAINDSGDIVGMSYTSMGGQSFPYSGGSGTFTTLVDPQSGATYYNYVNGINDSGVAVGTYIDSSLISHGFSYSNGSYTTIDDPNAPHGTVLNGINNNGDIVGYDVGSTSSFIDRNGTFTSITDPLGVNGTLAIGINDSDQIVGYYFDSSNTIHGFLYSNGSYTTIDDPNGTNGTALIGINDSGTFRVGIKMVSAASSIPMGRLLRSTSHRCPSRQRSSTA